MNKKCHYYYDYHNKGTSHSMYSYVPVAATKYCNVNPGRVHYVYLNAAYENSVSSSNIRVLPFPRQLLSIWFREMNCAFVQVGMNKCDLKCYYWTISACIIFQHAQRQMIKVHLWQYQQTSRENGSIVVTKWVWISLSKMKWDENRIKLEIWHESKYWGEK